MKRLRDEFPESFEASLLNADNTREPSPAARDRALDAGLRVVAVSAGAALTAGTAAASGGGAAAGAAAKTAAIQGVIAWKLWAVVAVVGSAAIGTGVVVSRSASDEPRPVPTVAEPPVVAAAPSVSASAEPFVREPPPAVAPAPIPSAPRAVRGDVPKSAPAPAAQPADAVLEASPTKKDDLAEEVGEIDKARGALAVHDAARALSVLDGYERRHPSGTLAREAAVLRVEALAMNGELGRAARGAEELLAESPDAPYRARLRKVIDQASAPPSR